MTIIIKKYKIKMFKLDTYAFSFAKCPAWFELQIGKFVILGIKWPRK